MAEVDRLELAARAAFAAFGHDVATPMPWEQAPEDFRITFRMVADAVLMVTEPLIREQIARDIEASVPEPDPYQWDGLEEEGDREGRYAAAKIARGGD